MLRFCRVGVARFEPCDDVAGAVAEVPPHFETGRTAATCAPDVDGAERNVEVVSEFLAGQEFGHACIPCKVFGSHCEDYDERLALMQNPV
jgi:hypothetical protein